MEKPERAIEQGPRRRRVGTGMLIFIMALVLCLAGSVSANDPSLGRVLPPSEFSPDWTLKDPVRFYDKESLFEHINGEAELFIPYGFDLLATATYVNKADPEVWLIADVYRMATLLDAFGVYANYRRSSSTGVDMGAEGFLGSSQAMFYQDRYFVRLQVTGATGLKPDVFLACGRAISGKLPRRSARPAELELLYLPDLVPGTERYLPHSLLGYAFFRRGLIADAVSDGKSMQVFLVLADSPQAARTTWEQYHAYLKAEGRNLRETATPQGTSLTADDPLYGTVLAEHSSRYVMGAVRVQDAAAAKRLVESLRLRLLNDGAAQGTPAKEPSVPPAGRRR